MMRNDNEVRTLQRPSAARKTVKADEHRIVRDILAACITKTERVAAWQEQTRKSERAFYRRLRELDEVTH
jgi:hypothetical protein